MDGKKVTLGTTMMNSSSTCIRLVRRKVNATTVSSGPIATKQARKHRREKKSRLASL